MVNKLALKSVENTFTQIKLCRGRFLPSAFIMTDEKRFPCFDSINEISGKNIAVIIRGYTQNTKLNLLETLRYHYPRRQFKILVSDDFELAIQADGLHIPEKKLKLGLTKWRRCRSRLGLVTASAHSESAIRRAVDWGVDSILLSPLARTNSSKNKRPLGVLRFARLCHKYKCPIIALGGVTTNHLRALRRAEAAGIAGVDIFLKSDK